MKSINITFIMICTLLIACNTNYDKAKKHFIKAKQFYKTEDYANASLEIQKSISIDSSNYDYLIYSAKIKRQLEKNNEAIDVLKRNYKRDTTSYEIAISYFAKSANLNNTGANILDKNKALRKAIKFYDNALNENIRYYNAYIEKYKALHNLHRYKEAIVHINQARSIFPDSIDLVLYRGIAKGTLGDAKEEMNDLNRVIGSRRLDSFNLSIAYRFRGRLH